MTETFDRELLKFKGLEDDEGWGRWLSAYYDDKFLGFVRSNSDRWRVMGNGLRVSNPEAEDFRFNLCGISPHIGGKVSWGTVIPEPYDSITSAVQHNECASWEWADEGLISESAPDDSARVSSREMVWIFDDGNSLACAQPLPDLSVDFRGISCDRDENEKQIRTALLSFTFDAADFADEEEEDNESEFDAVSRLLHESEDREDRLLSANLALMREIGDLEAKLEAAEALLIAAVTRIAELTPAPEPLPEWHQCSGVSGMGTPRVGRAFNWR